MSEISFCELCGVSDGHLARCPNRLVVQPIRSVSGGVSSVTPIEGYALGKDVLEKIASFCPDAGALLCLRATCKVWWTALRASDGDLWRRCWVRAGFAERDMFKFSCGWFATAAMRIGALKQRGLDFRRILCVAVEEGCIPAVCALNSSPAAASFAFQSNLTKMSAVPALKMMTQLWPLQDLMTEFGRQGISSENYVVPES